MGKIVHRHNQPGLNRYPFKNRSLTDMPGEKWKPVEGMDELFWISDKGRIKALPRLIQRKNQGYYWTKLKIVPQLIQKVPNKFTGDYTYQLYAGAVYERV